MYAAATNPTITHARGASKLSATAAAMSVATITPTMAQNSVVNGAHFVSNRRPVKRTPVRSARWPTVLSVASRVAIDPFPRLRGEDAPKGGAETQKLAVFEGVRAKGPSER